MGTGSHHACQKKIFSARDQEDATPSVVVFTVGHSTRSLDEFVLLLKAHGVQRVLDIRTIPRPGTTRS